MNERLPIAIWNARQRLLWDAATDEQKDGWDRYAQGAADAFNSNPKLDSYDSTNTFVSRDPETGHMTNWAPPLTFEQWLALRAHL